MKISNFLAFPLFVLLASACQPGSSGESGDAMGASPDTTQTAPAYAIQVLNADLPSPRKEMKGAIGSMEITVNYGSPSARGREIWGGLVPYGEVWRSGANEATAITFPADVLIQGQELKAGKYGLFTIPTPEQWTIIFNTVADQWGSYEYDETKDALRVNVVPEKDENAEELDYVIRGNKVALRWDKLAVPFEVAAK
jgi:hypothetical protein